MDGTDTLTVAQAARRDRVVRAALTLGANGGYESVKLASVARYRAAVSAGLDGLAARESDLVI